VAGLGKRGQRLRLHPFHRKEEGRLAQGERVRGGAVSKNKKKKGRIDNHDFSTNNGKKPFLLRSAGRKETGARLLSYGRERSG